MTRRAAVARERQQVSCVMGHTLKGSFNERKAFNPMSNCIIDSGRETLNSGISSMAKPISANRYCSSALFRVAPAQIRHNRSLGDLFALTAIKYYQVCFGRSCIDGLQQLCRQRCSDLLMLKSFVTDTM